LVSGFPAAETECFSEKFQLFFDRIFRKNPMDRRMISPDLCRFLWLKYHKKKMQLAADFYVYRQT
jgi:hypothetical protein